MQPYEVEVLWFEKVTGHTSDCFNIMQLGKRTSYSYLYINKRTFWFDLGI